ncbi:MAG: Do family serine endopeptidase [Candidatus Krumholzibacteriia bacterium]
MGSKPRFPVLMANVVFSAILVGVVVGIGLRSVPAGDAGNAGQDAAQAQSDTELDLRPESAPPEPLDARPFDVALRSPGAGAAGDRPRSSSALRTPAEADLFSFADVAEQVTPSVVTVVSQKRVGGDDFGGFFERFFGNRQEPFVQGHGSGFVLDSNGTILTNNHVVDDADDLTVRLKDGREFEAEVIGMDANTDIAVIRIDAQDLPVVKLGDSDRLRVGEWVLAIGSPFRQALDHTVTAGIISAKGRGNVGLADYEEFLQTDAAINPGNSGGPLVNLRGEVIGINTAIATRNGGFQGVSFAIPINFARNIIDMLLAEGRVTRAWLGVVIQDVTPELARGLDLPRPEGVAIAEVNENSPAEEAGLQEGDVIVAMDGVATERVSAFRNRVSLSVPGQRVELEVLRDGKRRTVEARLGELTEDVLAAVQNQRPRTPEGHPDSQLGLQLADLTPEIAARFDLSRRTSGVVITGVAPGSPAAEEGLEPGDVVRSVNRQRVQSVEEFDAALNLVPSNHPVVLNVKRGGRSFFITLDRTS